MPLYSQQCHWSLPFVQALNCKSYVGWSSVSRTKQNLVHIETLIKTTRARERKKIPHVFPSSSTLVPWAKHGLHDHQGNRIRIYPWCSIKGNSKLSKGHVIINDADLLSSINWDQAILTIDSAGKRQTHLRTSKAGWLGRNQHACCCRVSW